MKFIAYILLTLLSIQSYAYTEIEFVHSDIRGNTVATSDINGLYKRGNNFLPYGDIQTEQYDEGTFFLGNEYKASDKIVSIGKRFYIPSEGIFLTLDTYTAADGAQYFNPYQYGFNNPNAFVDPSGEIPIPLLVYGAYKLASLTMDAVDVVHSVSEGDYLSASITALGVLDPTGLANKARAAKSAVSASNMASVTRNADDVIHLPHTDKFGNVISRNPKSIQDQMALEAAQRGEGVVKIPSLSDPKFFGMQKMELEIISAGGKKSNVHYVRDPETGQSMDFKFVKHSTDYIHTYEKN